MGNPRTVRRLKEISKKYRPDILFLMETKNPDDFVLKKCDQLNYEEHLFIPPVGHGAGGLALFWNQNVKFTVLYACANVIETMIEFQGKFFYSSFVYGNNDRGLRKELWNQLLVSAEIRDAPWFLTGDLNDILKADEKVGGPDRPEGSYSDLRTFFSEGDLYDLHHSGDPLSWRGQRGTHLVRCRLDRAVANSSWAENYPTARCHYLEYEGSDHKPLVSFLDPSILKRKGLFRYDRRLSSNEEAKQVIRRAWAESSDIRIMDKLASTRGAISEWNRLQQRNSKALIEQNKFELEKALISPVNDTGLIKEINDKLEKAYIAEEAFWKQRSRLLWLQLGDRNTGFFHATTKNRHRRNAFTVLENEEGLVVYKEADIAKTVVDYYSNLFTSVPRNCSETVHLALKPVINQEENELLIAIPSATEIKEALFAINGEKAPGPDGFSASFYHTHWEDIGPDLVKEIQQAFSTGCLPPEINNTHVCLIPKITTPQRVSDYRPIALCNVYYKIFSKILQRRLQPLLDKLISENQSAFVPERAIGDNILITHEVLHTLKTSKAEVRVAMAVKTDMSKAYDRLEWNFISSVLETLGFHHLWIGLIMQCISSVTYSFLINGSPRGQVIPSRGIRQGDPLSPYIFILCSEVLSGLCNKAQQDGLIQGIQVARGCPRINHLLFADDTMFFLQASKESTAALKSILSRYEDASGQSINKEKSSITFSRKAPAELKHRVHSELQIMKEGGVGKYLGLPEHFGRRKRDLFASIVDRIKQKACGWSNRHLSAAGKLVMLQSVLTPIPSHSMSCFKLPVSLCKRIQSAFLRFWWDGGDGKRKLAWIAWDKMTLPKGSGGLGVRDIQAFNEAFLAKISVRLIEKPEGLLGRTLLPKYCPEGDLLSCSSVSGASHGWNSILAGRDLLLKKSSWLVGNGEDIRVWDDPWLSLDCPRRPMGPPPLGSKDWVVKDLIIPGTGAWNRELIQAVLPFEEESILRLQPSSKDAPDALKWIGTREGKYSVKSGYHAAMEEFTETILEDEPAVEFDWRKTVWNLKIAPKVKMFTWKSLKGILPVGERLEARHIAVNSSCKRCGSLESINHLLFYCPFAREVWDLSPFLGGFGISGLTDLRADWSDLHAAKCLPPAGITSTPLFPWILWFLWKARNKYVFENFAGKPAETLSMAIAAAREWEIAQWAIEKKYHPRAPGTPFLAASVIQSDAAWEATSNNAGLSWILKTEDQSMTGMKGVSFISSALIAEGLAMREAMAACKLKGLRKVRFESDSSQLITAINRNEPPLELYGIVQDIVCLARDFEIASFFWIPRLKNVNADLLAKSALIVFGQEVAGNLLPPPN